MDVILKIVKSIAILVTGLPPSASWQDLIVWIGSLFLWPFDTCKDDEGIFVHSHAILLI